MSGRQEPNESGERKGEREMRGDLSKAGQHHLTDSVYVREKKHQTHFHDLCLSSQHYSLYPSPQNRSSQSKLNSFKCIF